MIDRKVSLDNRAAFNWIAANTPTDSRFLVLTGNLDLVSDWTLEWFPALTSRINETTIQGSEWIDGRHFLQHVNQVQAIQKCVSINPSLSCVEAQAKELDAQFDYIYVATKTAVNNFATTTRGETLISELEQAEESYRIVYQTDEAVIFKRHSKP